MSTQQTPPPIIPVTSNVAADEGALLEVDPDRGCDVLEPGTAEAGGDELRRRAG